MEGIPSVYPKTVFRSLASEHSAPAPQPAILTGLDPFLAKLDSVL